MKTFYIHTLGCPKNQVDSEQLKALLKSKGLSHAGSINEADIVLINTCGFINDAKEESIEHILEIAVQKRATQKVLVFGCLVQRYMKELKEQLPEVDGFFGVHSQDEILSYLGINGKTDAVCPQEDLPETFPYAYIKISEGCNRQCSFCAIPSIRGPYRSRPPEAILAEAERLLNRGIRELILVAQDTTSYGYELNGYGLPELLRDITSFSGDYWVRILYLYPTSITDELIEVFSTSPKLCRYLDIPFQHSVPRILRLMHRRGSGKEYLELICRLREGIEGVVLRTTLIVGFPSETEEDFQQLLRFVELAEFDCLGVFKYSNEEGTRAFEYKPQVPERVKEERFHRLMRLQADISMNRNRRYTGKRLRVLVDEVEGDSVTGRFYGQAPEIDGVVFIDSGDNRAVKGEFVDVEIHHTDVYDLWGRIR